MSTDKKPIHYTASITPRFSDFDPYGHLGASAYLDMVITSRWVYQRETWGITAKTFLDKNFGFYLSRFEMDYKRPVLLDQGTLHVVSWIENVDTTKIPVRFEIWNEKKEKLHASGTFYFVSMNLKEMKPELLPEWILPYIFETGKIGS